MGLDRGGPRVIFGDGFQVLHGDLADLQSMIYKEMYDGLVARLFGVHIFLKMKHGLMVC